MERQEERRRRAGSRHAAVAAAWAALFGGLLLAASAGCGGERSADRRPDSRTGGEASPPRGAESAAGATSTTRATGESGRAAGPASDTLAFEIGGFRTPESVLWDPQADVYIVSNINGDPLGKDDNGFLSRVSPAGEVQALQWVDGASPSFRLHAPKGLALRGDTLFVADIDSVRAFHRTTGAPLGARVVAGATFLNGLAVGPDGTLFVTDSGLGPGFRPSGTDAVYRFHGPLAVPIARGDALGHPNGIVAVADSVTFVTFGAAAVRRLPATAAAGSEGSAPRTLATLPGGQLDGIVAPADGSLLVSSWELNAVLRLPAGGGPATVVADSLPSPAGIGWDESRRRLLVPLFESDRVAFRPVRP